MNKKIALCGFYGYQNYGDTFMLKELDSVLSSNSIQVIPFSDRESIEEELKVHHHDQLDTSDFSGIALGGGGIISKNFWFFKKNFHQSLGKPLILLNIGLTTEAEPVFAELGDKISLIVVRDKFSFDLASKYYPNKVIYVPDVTYLNRINLEQADIKNNISVCLNYYIFKNYFSQNHRERIFAEKAIIELASFLNYLINNGKIINLAPCQTDIEVNDNIILGVLNGFLNKKANWSYSRNDIEKTIINSELLISSRYHSSLFALKAGIPFIDITHHSKNLNFLRDVGLLDYSVNYWNLELNSLINKYKKIIDNKQLLSINRQYGVYCDEGWAKVVSAISDLLK